MPYNGSGTFTLVAGNPVVTGTTISSTVQNNTMSDFATGFTTCVTKDGQTATTAVIPFASGITVSGGSTFSSYVENTFVPTVTLVGGAGNTVPVYSTNTGRYTRIGNRVFVDIYLTGDGGAEGAGTGTMTIALPITSGASNPAATINCGYYFNNATLGILAGSIGAGGGVISLNYWSTISAQVAFTGADQNNASRLIRLQFFYEV